MPARYVAIRDSIRQQHPEMALADVKTEAAKIFNSTRKPHEASLQTTVKRERAKRATGRWR